MVALPGNPPKVSVATSITLGLKQSRRSTAVNSGAYSSEIPTVNVLPIKTSWAIGSTLSVIEPFSLALAIGGAGDGTGGNGD